ncbi:hypothetical protein N7468_000687 [Penicillium chermesinum]|uniref:Allantoin permease n=1 Tax=Penicillium chermesinum TaxID=63820 RepID=A0A9W9PKS5_9EURO|nr:uncharacterized protein N7468_000687 [Penicillium chermesinum]KAJ5249236.1 hypothetical protein N7468_000687 [Penicillium chermesinum]
MFDFWVINRRRYDTLALYQPWNPIYRYTSSVSWFGGISIWGWNWRAVVAFLVGVAPSLPGLINAVNSSINVGAGIHPYQFGWLLGFCGTTVVYVALSWLFPARDTQIDHAVLPDEVYDERAIIVEGVDTDKSSDREPRIQHEKMPVVG